MNIPNTAPISSIIIVLLSRVDRGCVRILKDFFSFLFWVCVGFIIGWSSGLLAAVLSLISTGMPFTVSINHAIRPGLPLGMILSGI